MSGARFEKGERVASTVRYGNGLSKQRPGTVVECNGKSVRVLYDDAGSGDGGARWLAPNQIVSLAPTGEARRMAPTPAEATPTSATVEAPPTLQELESRGMDPVAMYLALGAALRGRAESDLRAAQEAVAAADEQVRDADALLVEARREAVAARARLEKARSLATELDRRVV